jgi:hypothetical protein
LIVVGLLVGCGGAVHTPTPEELGAVGVFTAAVKSNEDNGNHYGQEKNGNNGNHTGWENGNHYGWENGNGGGKCQVVSTDPLADEMPAFKLDQDFEKEPVGPVKEVHRWLDAEGSSVEVTTATAYEGRKSLRVVSAGDVTSGYDAVAVKFCVRCEAMKRFRAEFAIKFENFINWTGIAITNSPSLAYYWWVRANGSIFDVTTFDDLQVGQWHQVFIDIDRDQNLAQVVIDGKYHEVPLDPTWPSEVQSQPMGCVRLLLMESGGQTVHLDNVRVDAID